MEGSINSRYPLCKEKMHENQNNLASRKAQNDILGQMKLVDMLNQWFAKNSQTKFAAAAGVQQSTVSRWKNTQIPPTFENCLRIARALNADPLDIFDAADKPEYKELFRFFLPDYKPKPEATTNTMLIGNIADHRLLHEKLQEILESKDVEAAKGIAMNINYIHLALQSKSRKSKSGGATAEKRKKAAGSRDPFRSAKTGGALSEGPGGG